MRLSTLALYSCLIAAAASAHISGINNIAKSSSSALIARDASSASSSSSSIANLSLAKRGEEAVEEVVEIDGDVDNDDDEDDDEDADDEESTLEPRGRKHKKHRKTHHRSRKHSSSSSKGHRRSRHHKKPKHQTHSNSASPSSVAGSTFRGKGTFFKPNQGACGARNTVNDHIVALSADVYKGGKHCFEGVKVCYRGKCVPAKVADLCPGCPRTSLDMSPSLFKALANPDLGTIDISWSFA